MLRTVKNNIIKDLFQARQLCHSAILYVRRTTEFLKIQGAEFGHEGCYRAGNLRKDIFFGVPTPGYDKI